jgi:hypothetical protein
VRVGGGCLQRRGLEALGGRVELGREALCAVELVGRDGDVDPGWEKSRPRSEADCLVGEQAADRAPRALGVAAREAKQRMPGLRVVAVLVGLSEGLLGLGEVAEAESRLPELVEGRAGDPRASGSQFLPGLAR